MTSEDRAAPRPTPFVAAVNKPVPQDRATPRTEAGKALMRFMGWGPAWAKKVIAIEDEMEARLSPPPVAAVADRAAQEKTVAMGRAIRDLVRKPGANTTANEELIANLFDLWEAAAPGAAALDVERLYEAMVWLDNDDPGAFNIVAISEPDTRPVAAALAVRYQRLTPRAAEPKPPDSKP